MVFRIVLLASREIAKHKNVHPFLTMGRRARVLTAFLLVLFSAGVVVGDEEKLADRFAHLALACVHQEYPNKISHVMSSDADVMPPRELTPAFFGCFDWHSAVHGHWLLARIARSYPEGSLSGAAKTALTQSLSKTKIEAETRYLESPARSGFERPYGLAWLLQLAAELEEWDDPIAAKLSTNISPLVVHTRRQLSEWLVKLAYPIRTGEHSQTAFAFGLILDWAEVVDDMEMFRLVERKSRDFYLHDKNCPLAYEPSGQDFLSPCLAEADLMRRIMDETEYSEWLKRFLPGIPLDNDSLWLPLAIITDRIDGKLAHLDGLHISRAWMLYGILNALGEEDNRRAALGWSARKHAEAGLSAVTGEHYSGGHWLGSFATYLVTERGLKSSRISQ